jgi:hypothetical protein
VGLTTPPHEYILLQNHGEGQDSHRVVAPGKRTGRERKKDEISSAMKRLENMLKSHLANPICFAK